MSLHARHFPLAPVFNNIYKEPPRLGDAVKRPVHCAVIDIAKDSEDLKIVSCPQ